MRLLHRRGIRRTTLISVGLSSLLVGLFLAYKNISAPSIWLALIPGLTFVIYKFKKLRLVSVVLIGLLIGLWRGSVVFADLQKYQTLYGTKVSFLATVADDPGFNNERSQTEFQVSGIQTNTEKYLGKVQVSMKKGSKVGRGDLVQVWGKLKPIKGTSKQGAISAADLKVVKQNTGWLEKFRTRFFASVQRALPEPYASLGLGYLVGLRASIPKELSDQLKIVGLTHIIAVSGYNLTIIVQAVRRISAKRSAYQAVLFTSLLLMGFLLVAGGSAPITRAAVVCGFSLLAWYYGREVKPVTLLLLSGTLTALVNPLYVWGDPGWYLSFLAFAGVLILAPLVTKFLFRNKQPATVTQIFIETICAQLTTIPYTLYLFGSVSVIAPLANLLVLPFIPTIMLTVFIVGLMGLVSPVLAAAAGLVPGSLLTLQVWFIEKLSSVPSASSELPINLSFMIILFAALILITIILSKLTSRRQDDHLAEIDYNLL